MTSTPDKMAPKNIEIDVETFQKLLDESNDFFEESKKVEEEEEENDVTSWYQKFSHNIKNGMGALNSDGFSRVVKEKVEKLKVRFSPKEEDQELPASQDNKTGGDIRRKEDFEKIRFVGESLQTFRVNVMVKVTRRVQQLVRSHAVALDFVQVLLNKLEERMAKMEDKVNVEEGWLEQEVKKQIQDVKEKVTKLEVDKEVMARQLDEARQRGMKGNIIISTKRGKQHLLEPSRSGGSLEKETAMAIRIIANKTGVHLLEDDILACHRIGRKEAPAYVIRILNQKAGTGWETLSAGMTSGRGPLGNFINDDIFLNFQLTDGRRELLKNVREARKKELLKKFKVDANGKIWITKEKGLNGVMKKLAWEEVKDLAGLSLTCGQVFPPPVVEGAGAAGGGGAVPRRPVTNSK